MAGARWAEDRAGGRAGTTCLVAEKGRSVGGPGRASASLEGWNWRQRRERGVRPEGRLTE